MLKIKYLRLSANNETVLAKLDKHRELLKIMMKRKPLYLVHIIRGRKHEILVLIIDGKVAGKENCRKTPEVVTKKKNITIVGLVRTSVEIFLTAVNKAKSRIYKTKVIH